MISCFQTFAFKCMNSLNRRETTNLLALVLPLIPPKARRCSFTPL